MRFAKNGDLDIGGYPKDSINNKNHPDHNKPGFLVRATEKGYYGLAMREVGDVFKLQYARHFSDHNDPRLNGVGWMEKVDGKPEPRRRQPSEEARGAKPAAPDPSERDRAMANVDKMEREAAEEDKAIAAEAEVI